MLLLLFFPSVFYAQSPYQEKLIKIHKGPVNAVQFHPDGRRLLSASSDKRCRIYDTETGRVVITIPFDREVHAATFTPDGKYIVAGAGSYLKIYTTNGEYYKTYKGHSTAIWSLETGPGGRYVVTGSYDKAFYLWDIIEGKKQQTFTGHVKSVLAVAFSPDGKTVASGSLDQTVRLWKINEPSGMPVQGNHSGNIVDLAFSPDGKLLASASRDQQVILWDVATGRKVKSFAHPSEVFSVTFSPDGTYLVSGTLHGDLFLWDITGGKQIVILQGHTAAVLSLSFRPDGNMFASGSYDGTIRLWRPDPEIFVMYAFQDSLNTALAKNPLNKPRAPGESRTGYQLRLKQFSEWRQKLIEKYYQQYLRERKPENPIEK
ncbi:MAG: WD40 repeat domain-containing protein [Chlorobi bacterium]|nr:WD40 repeat domain-containing protein [Chlorobiota bacterium]